MKKCEVIQLILLKLKAEQQQQQKKNTTMMYTF